jgi:hypothetical protein
MEHGRSFQRGDIMLFSLFALVDMKSLRSSLEAVSELPVLVQSD